MLLDLISLGLGLFKYIRKTIRFLWRIQIQNTGIYQKEYRDIAQRINTFHLDFLAICAYKKVLKCDRYLVNRYGIIDRKSDLD